MAITDRDFQKLNQTDTYAIICEMLYTLKDNPSYSTMSELAYLLDRKSFIHLIKYFGGETITIPTVDEFKKAIKVILLYQYFNIDGLSWRESLLKSGYACSETRQAQKHLIQLSNILESIKLGRGQD